MMRLTMIVWWSLALVWLLTSQTGVGAARGQAARREEVSGQGASYEDARRAALQKAVVAIAARLDELRLRHWEPDESFVRNHGLDGPGRAGPEETLADDVVAKTWMFSVRIPADEVLMRLDAEAAHRQLAERRMGWTLRVLAGLALILAAVVGCVRVDAWTQARYTLWWRLVGAAVTGAVVTGWWLSAS